MIGKVAYTEPNGSGHLQLSFSGGAMQYFVSHEDWVKLHGTPGKGQEVEMIFRKPKGQEYGADRPDYLYYGFVPKDYELTKDELEMGWFRK